MIGTSAAELLLIRLFIAFFRYAPLLYAAALVAVSTLFRASQWRARASATLTSLLAAETLFYLLVQVPYARRLTRAAVHPEPLTPAERRALFDECMRNVDDPASYLRWWFLGAELHDIRRDNLRDFFLWAFFDARAESAPAADDDDDIDDVFSDPRVQRELDEYLAVVEDRLGTPLLPGRGPAKCLRLTFDDINTTYRGLTWYLVVFLVDQATHAAMLWHGFRYYARSPAAALKTFPPRPQELVARHRSSAPELGYWYRPHVQPPDAVHEGEGDGEQQLPVVFFHGIGIGLWTYVRFVAELRGRNGIGDGADTRGVIVPEVMSISFRLAAPPPPKAEFLRQLGQILDQHGPAWDRFALVSHSYGSVLTTHVLSCPGFESRVPSVVLVDPVSVMLHLPDVAYNFTRRRPRAANEWQLWYFASTDPGVAHCLGRHFFWRDNIVWKRDLLGGGRRRAAVTLSGRDLIVDAAAVAEYLAADGDGDAAPGATHTKVEVIVFPDIDHAQVFDRPRDRKRVIDVVDSHCTLSRDR
ncbi:alpha beta hydrolase fold family [Purpureocillium lavendulum]|uniref:Alpha beta hydrolase fold family n=1 Tax=Purpureocillium lavendulum TaxID=1247861 RepID=A0AB34FEW0_9HYPO|nr:alpha beta hydrolase fold family [Purpureocillium lavendulum]